VDRQGNVSVTNRTRIAAAVSGIPFPIWVIGLLVAGLGAGVLWPKSAPVHALYSGVAYFPKLIVNLAPALIFNLLAAATAKIILLHHERAGRLFGLVVALYVAMGGISLLYAAVWIYYMIGIPLTNKGGHIPSLTQWLAGVFRTFRGVLQTQPLLQVLLAAIGFGYLCAKCTPLRPIAYGYMVASDWILKGFKKLLWFYPIMIGCLAIGIPMKFGLRGVSLYGQAVLWIAIVTVVWSMLMVAITKLTTRRTWGQLAAYFGSVWPTGFGTGGSYDTLAVNILSAERDLKLKPEIAEVSIVFGTILNKNCATMSVLVITVVVCWLLKIPISMIDIFILIPPVMILGLESPGIPGGAGFFMSPIIAVLLNVPDPSLFATTFVTMYSGLVPMFATAGNTTDDGIVGCWLNDTFEGYLEQEKRRE
jgi:Na+/H+-dicarboxylate symporter